MSFARVNKRAALLGLVLVLALVSVSAVLVGLDAAQADAAGASYPVTVNTAAIATTTTFDADVWSYSGDDATTAEIFWDIDQGGTPNTLTLALEVSPDGSIWASAGTLVSNNVADSTSYTTTTIVGRQFRIEATVGNTQTVTPTIKAVYR